MNADKATDLNKQVGLIDLYLTDAVNHAKFLSSLADAAAGPNDKVILAEARKNLDSAIDRGLVHVDKLRSYKSELAAAAGTNLAALDDLERQLKNAKASGAKLAVAQIADLSGAVDGVSTHLMGADAAFRSVAKWTNYTRLSSTNLSTVPVRGDELPPSDTNRDLGKSAGPHDTATPVPTTAPGMTSPGTRPPSPSIREPVQPAPGQPVK